jgi:ribonuclease J
MEEASRTVRESVDRCLDQHITDWSRIKTEVKDDLSDFVWKRTQRRPMILPIIMEASL